LYTWFEFLVTFFKQTRQSHIVEYVIFNMKDFNREVLAIQMKMLILIFQKKNKLARGNDVLERRKVVNVKEM